MRGSAARVRCIFTTFGGSEVGPRGERRGGRERMLDTRFSISPLVVIWLSGEGRENMQSYHHDTSCLYLGLLRQDDNRQDMDLL